MDGWIDRTCLHLLSLTDAAPQHAAGSLQINANSLGGRGSLRPFDGAFCCWRSGRKNPEAQTSGGLLLARALEGEGEEMHLYAICGIQGYITLWLFNIAMV